MKNILSLVLIAFVLSPAVAHERTLNSVYRIMLFVFESKGDDPRINSFRNVSHECLRIKLRLAEFGEKVVDEDFGLLAATASSFLCSEDMLAAYGASLNQILSNVPVVDDIECYKRRLVELEPTSVVIKGFNIDPTIACKSPLFTESELKEKNTERLRIFTKLNLLKCVNTDLNETELTELKESILKVMDGEEGGINDEVREVIYAEMRKEHGEVFECCMDEMVSKFGVK
jgi:hypothetical protein